MIKYRESEELRTSEEWVEQLQPGAYVVEPEGWDMDNYTRSWFEEPIPKDEFEMRFYQSKVKFPEFTKEIWL